MSSAAQTHTLTLGATRKITVDYSPELDPGPTGGTPETLSGTPTVTVSPTTVPPLTVGTASVSGAVLNVNDVDVLAGQAVQFSVSGGKAAAGAGTDYTLTITVSTSTGETLVDTITVKVRV